MIVQYAPNSNMENMEEYDFLDNEILIGSGYININVKMNNVYIFVKPEFRSQGYGSYITKHMIEKLYNNNINQITILLESENFLLNYVKTSEPHRLMDLFIQLVIEEDEIATQCFLKYPPPPHYNLQ